MCEFFDAFVMFYKIRFFLVGGGRGAVNCSFAFLKICLCLAAPLECLHGAPRRRSAQFEGNTGIEDRFIWMVFGFALKEADFPGRCHFPFGIKNLVRRTDLFYNFPTLAFGFDLVNVATMAFGLYWTLLIFFY